MTISIERDFPAIIIIMVFQATTGANRHSAEECADSPKLVNRMWERLIIRLTPRSMRSAGTWNRHAFGAAESSFGGHQTRIQPADVNGNSASVISSISLTSAASLVVP